MRVMVKTFGLVLILGLLLQPTGIFGQNLEEQLQQMVAKNANSYVQPIVTSAGIGLNSGVYRTAKVHKLLGFDVTVNMTGISIPDKAKTYTFDTSNLQNVSFDFTYSYAGQNQTVPITLNAASLYPSVDEAPTFFGSDEAPDLEPNTDYARNEIVSQVASSNSNITEQDVENQFGTEVDQALSNNVQALSIIPPGIDLNYFATPSLQASVGLPLGIEAQLRYAPPMTITEDIGDFGLFGVGGRISVDQFIPVPFFPVDIAAGAFYQSLTLGPVDISSSIIHAEVSKSIPMLTVYGGFGLESSTLTAKYTMDNPDISDTPQEYEIEIDGENSFRTTVGVRLKLLLLSINADYSLSEYPSANLGVGVTFR